MMSLLFLSLFICFVYSRNILQDVYGTFAATPEVYDQILDHFNAYNSATFPQRWFYNDSFWSPESLSPIIFQAGGEGQNNGGFYGFVEEFAQEVGALLVTAEHRFYGKSRPFGDGDANYEPTSDKLGLLQVEQAMADYLELMTFWKSSSNKYFKNCSMCPVIVVGGSYPGELSVWLRMKYPHMFDMALGASAPIFYTSNNLVKSEAYYEVVTNAVNKISSKCVDYVKAAYDVLMKSSETEIINGIPICANTYRNIDELQALLYENWANYAMGNYPPSTSPMKSACNRIEDGSINDGLAIWNRFFEPNLRNGCLDMSRYIPNGANGTIHCSDLTGCGSGYDGESWDYQACSQNIEPFSTNNITDMFPVYVWSMDWLDKHCMSRFKIKASDRESWMEKEFGLSPPYFENKFAEITSRIIFSNGEQDGWSAGGVLKNMSDSLIAIVIPNGAHHSDMRGSSALDTQDIINARQQEKDILKKWIKQVQQENM